MRRCLTTMFAASVACVFLFAIPVAAQASTVAIPWISEYETDLSDIGYLSDDESMLMSDALIQCAQSDCHPATSRDVDFEQAIRDGYSSYYEDGTEVKMADTQAAYAKAKRNVVHKYYKTSANKNLNKSDYAAIKRARQYRLTSESSDIAHASESTGIDSAKVIASSTAQDDDMLAAVNALDDSAAVKTALSTGLHGSLAFLGKVNDVAGAEQLGVSIGNGLVSVFDIDQSAECQTITNGIARFALGINSVCKSYDDSKVPAISPVQLTGSVDGASVLGIVDVPAEGQVHNYAYCIAKPQKFYVLGVYNNGQWISLDRWSGMHRCGAYGDDNSVWTFWGSAEVVPTISNTVCAKSSYFGSCITGTETTLTATSDGQVTPVVSVDGSDGKTYSAKGTPQKEGGPMSLPSVQLPSGVSPKSVTVTKSVVADDGTTQALVDHQPLQMPQHTNGSLDLVDAATGNSCYHEAYACADWASQVQTATGKAVQLDNSTTTQTDPATKMPYKCIWDGADGTATELGIGECTALKSAYREDNQATGETATDPSTGEQLKTPVEPKADGDVSFSQCVTTQVSWNPVSWVFVPVKCALKWAFEPDPANLKTKTVLVQQQAHYSLPGKLQTTFTSAMPSEPTLQCQGPELNIDAMGYKLFSHAHPLSVCPGTGLEYLPVISKVVITLFAGIGAILIIRHHVSQVANMNDTGAAL